MSGLGVTEKVMIGTTLLGCVAGMIGCFAVLRRRALVGDMLAHAALPGLCLAFLISGGRNFAELFLGALIAGVVGVALVTFAARWTRTKEDAAIGIVLSTFFGLGIVLLSVIRRLPRGNKSGLDTFLFGQAASMRNQDLLVFSGIAVLVLGLLMLMYKEFKILCFDPDFAAAQGWPTVWLDLTMMATLAVVTVVGLPAVGVVLMAALIIIPAATAGFWTNRLGPMLLLSGAIGGASSALGTAISAGRFGWQGAADVSPLHASNLPTGPLIVLCGAAMFTISLLLAPDRGILMRMLTSAVLRRSTRRQGLLRAIYELGESEQAGRAIVAFSSIVNECRWSERMVRRWIRQLERRQLVERLPGGVRLTQAGAKQAARITRAHRLWELYLLEGANIDLDLAERDADSIQQLLGPDVVARLENELRDQGRLPSASTV